MAVTRPTRRFFGNVLAHWDCVRVAQLSYSDDVGWFHPSFPRKSRFTAFRRGLGTWRNSGPLPTKKFGPEKNRQNVLKILLFVAVSEVMFSSKTERFFFSFSALGALYRGREH